MGNYYGCQLSLNIIMLPYKKLLESWGVAQVALLVSNKYQALSLNASTITKIKLKK
jgi:hypothetical protein